MRRYATWLAISLLTVLPAAADPWDDALAGVGLTRQTAVFPAADMAMIGQGDFQVPLYRALSSEPLSGPFHARVFRAGMLASRATGDLVMAGTGKVGIGTRRTLLGDPLAAEAKRAKEPGALLAAIEEIWKAAGRPPSSQERKRLATAVKDVPFDVAEQAAFLLLTERKALTWRARGLSPAVRAGHSLDEVFGILTGATADEDVVSPRYQAFMRAVDLPRLMVGGEELAIAVDRATTALAERTGTEVFSFKAWTPYGWILLRGAGDDRIDRAQPNLLILDTGGNDSYASGGGTHSAAFPVSVLFDAGGDDRYDAAGGKPIAETPERKTRRVPPSFGAGVLGYGILIDAAGNDLFRGFGSTQGRGAFGLGVLEDRAGDDTYDAYTTAQGSAEFGAGILHDLAGKDTYLCFGTSQGFAGTMGFGLLLDRGAGADTYTADDTQIDFPSGQTAEHNGSLSQGAAFGRRADFSDGHSLAGGVAALLDEGGDNTLTAGVFAQGTGYWMGVGMCLLGPGNDTLRGIWYVQGNAAHFAVGILDDLGGNDTYEATTNMAQGAGHDYSVGWLIDHAGNDTYRAPSLALGGGNACGLGFFWDRGGNERYFVTQARANLGGAAGGGPVNTLRERSVTLGLFLDSGGNDQYPKEIPAANDNASWTSRKPEDSPGGERGTGLDGNWPDLREPTGEMMNAE